MAEEFIGYTEQLRLIREAISNPQESSVINVIGTYGSGRSSLLRYIREQVVGLEKTWQLPQTRAPKVVLVDGQSFVKKDKFLDFLARHVNSQLREAKGEPAPTNGGVDYMIRRLHDLSADDHMVLIIVDNFPRILERIRPEEVQGLNRLKLGAHYIFVTDSRSIREIAPSVVATSDFFKSVQHVTLPPLERHDALALLRARLNRLQSENGVQRCVFEPAALEFIYELAGGNQGLLTAVLRRAYFDHCRDLSNENGNTIGRQAVVDKRFLRYLPVDDSVRGYLRAIVSSGDYLGDETKKEFLVDIAMNTLSESDEKWQLLKYDTALHKKLNVMGFLARPSELRFDSRLLQYTVLSEFIPVSFSDAERRALEILMRSRPTLVSFEQLEELLHDDAGATEQADIRRYVDSTVSRVRKKLAAIPNNDYFRLENVRGRGFFLASPIPFDIYLEKSADTSQGVPSR